jgi:beta-lactam-binding protein with PASTA domain
MGLLVFILASAAFLSAVTAMRFAIRGREVDMPDLVGKTSADAQVMLQSRGLQMKVADRIYNALPPNIVVRQSPPAGEHMKISQDAHVVLSLGAQVVIVPSLVGQSLRAAQIELLQAGLQLGEVSSFVMQDAPVDTVLQQSPVSGTRASSPHVDLLVAEDEPPPAYVMPWLVGLPLPDAERQISSVGLKLTKINYSESPQWPKGTVIQQTPDRGAKVSADSEIALVVSQ